MSDENFKPRRPDYKGEGIAVWKNHTKERKIYLTIKILGNIKLNAFKNEEPEKQKEDI